MHIYRLFILVPALILAFSELFAQPINISSVTAHEQRIYAQFGLDDAFTATLGYLYALPIGSQEQPLILSTELALPVAEFDLRDYRTAISARYTALRHDNIAATAGVGIVARGTDNDIFSAFNIGARAEMELGYYADGWFAGTSVQYDKTLASHITNSDWYRTYFFQEAKDGWYGSTGGNFTYSLLGGFAVDRSELTLQAGFSTTEHFHLPLLSWHGTLGYSYRI